MLCSSDDYSEESHSDSRFQIVATLARAAFLAVLLGFIGSPQEAEAQTTQPPRRYRITDLGTLGGSFSRAYGINDKGQVVGEALDVLENDTLAFVWTGGPMSSIPGLSGGPYVYSQASAINNSDKVVGTFDPNASPGDPSSLFLYDIATGRSAGHV